MTQLNHQQIFNLLLKEINELDSEPDRDLKSFSKKILGYLHERPKTVCVYFQYDFKNDDKRISPTEQFLLDWAEDEWVKKDGNEELYQKISKFLEGEKQDWDLYEKELLVGDSENILKFDTLLSEIQQLEYLDKFVLLSWLLYQPETLLETCNLFYFLKDDKKVDRSEQVLLDWIQTEWIDKKENQELADVIAMHLAQKSIQVGAKRFQTFIYKK